ncbi:MAG TPA: hypothetical protein VHX86_14545 [Tepidisphaeraceae bacterium]|jgi:hypothetical protein|nr:hypothetical protein [Tepidisphaeraceae bacterium]
MKNEKCRQCCADCRRRTDHTVRHGRTDGRGADAYHIIEYECQVCGRVAKAKCYPNYLAGFFSLPAAQKGGAP